MKLPLSVQLWRVLTNPPHRHPLYRRSAVPRVGPEWLRAVKQVIAPIAPVAFLGGAVVFCCSLTSRSVLLLLPAASLVVLYLSGTFDGTGWTLQIASSLATARENKGYELLCLLPNGALGAVWAMASGVMHRENALRRRYTLQRTLLTATLLMLLILSLGALFDRRSVINGDIIVMYAVIFGLLAAFYADFIQTVVLSGLTGLLAGHIAGRRTEAELWAGMLFLAVKLVMYALAAVIGFGLLPALIPLGSGPEWPREILLVVLRVGTLVGVQELVVRQMWRSLAERLNTTAAQLDVLARAA